MNKKTKDEEKIEKLIKESGVLDDSIYKDKNEPKIKTSKEVLAEMENFIDRDLNIIAKNVSDTLRQIGVSVIIIYVALKLYVDAFRENILGDEDRNVCDLIMKHCNPPLTFFPKKRKTEKEQSNE